SPPTSQSRQATDLSRVRLSVLQILGKLLLFHPLTSDILPLRAIGSGLLCHRVVGQFGPLPDSAAAIVVYSAGEESARSCRWPRTSSTPPTRRSPTPDMTKWWASAVCTSSPPSAMSPAASTTSSAAAPPERGASPIIFSDATRCNVR